MTILNVSEINHAAIEVAGFAIPVQPVAEAQLTLPVTARGAGQRRLRMEMACAPMLKAANERPADDLQKVYEIFSILNRNDNNKWGPYIERCFAHYGDIESMKVLIKYGRDIVQNSPIFFAIDSHVANRYDMVRLLAENGATLPIDVWVNVAFHLFSDGSKQHSDDSAHYDVSEAKLAMLEFLLDHGTQVNQVIPKRYARPLTCIMNMTPTNDAERVYKDRLIKMLVDRGAKL